MSKHFIYHTDDYNGFSSDFLFSEKSIADYKSWGIWNGYTLVCEAVSCKRREIAPNKVNARVFASLDNSRKFFVFSDGSALEAK
jgi:hypothetical protein